MASLLRARAPYDEEPEKPAGRWIHQADIRMPCGADIADRPVVFVGSWRPHTVIDVVIGGGAMADVVSDPVGGRSGTERRLRDWAEFEWPSRAIYAAWRVVSGR